ncbi:hypothetical protein QG37_05837 [Candidozyma auris]|nr:hypothetical protein QG37_05837 [[Candida] auris]
MRSVETSYKACVRTRVATSARLKPVVGAARGTGEEAIVFGKKKRKHNGSFTVRWRTCQGEKCEKWKMT